MTNETSSAQSSLAAATINYPAIDNGTSPAIDKAIKLLIIDDDMSSIQLMIEYLRDYDFAVETASSAYEGLEKARESAPDLILLDISMPVMDGFAVLEQLKSRQITCDIPVFIISAHADTAQKVLSFHSGARDYLTKPVDAEELTARITSHLQFQDLKSSLENKLRHYEQRYGELNDEVETNNADHSRIEVEMLHRARQILRENLASPPTLNDLAQTLGTNQPRLSRIFRTLYGTTVFGFIRELRLQRARELLISTKLPVKTVALEVGYRNTSDLTRGIKDRFGMTPTQLRDRH